MERAICGSFAESEGNDAKKETKRKKKKKKGGVRRQSGVLGSPQCIESEGWNV